MLVVELLWSCRVIIMSGMFTGGMHCKICVWHPVTCTLNRYANWYHEHLWVNLLHVYCSPGKRHWSISSLEIWDEVSVDDPCKEHEEISSHCPLSLSLSLSLSFSFSPLPPQSKVVRDASWFSSLPCWLCSLGQTILMCLFLSSQQFPNWPQTTL